MLRLALKLLVSRVVLLSLCSLFASCFEAWLLHCGFSLSCPGFIGSSVRAGIEHRCIELHKWTLIPTAFFS